MGQGKRSIALISFTDRGRQVNLALKRGLEEKGYVCRSYEKRRSKAGERELTDGKKPEEEKQRIVGKEPERERCQAAGKEPEEEAGAGRAPAAETAVIAPVKESVGQWAGQRFQDSQALIFIGAVGIAVRSVAPWIRDKWTDPAVIGVDETGSYVIPLLSGHVGGANELALKAAEILNGTPVITTATDVNHQFAVDVFAVKNGLQITDRNLAKDISAQILEGGPVGMFSDYALEGPRPKELVFRQICRQNIWITRRRDRVGERAGCEETQPPILRLVPKTIHVGVGCRRGTSFEQIQYYVLRVLEQWNCAPEAVAAVASADLKEKEPGILKLAESFHVPFHTFTARQLSEAEGEFQESDFVAQVTGVGNVCERAALLSSGGKVICHKQVFSGVTVALAEEEWKGTFCNE